MATTANVKPLPQYIDIGVNLTDPVFRGRHRGSQKHPDDFDEVMKRSTAAGVRSMIITGGSLHESKEALIVAKEQGVFATVGCHPTRSGEFEKFHGGASAYLKGLDALIAGNMEGLGRVVAVGECGLDYDRLFFADQQTQKKHFRSQLALAKKYHLPLFLHSRAAHADFVNILKEEGFGEEGGRAAGGRGGVVHSFTGKLEEMQELVAMGFHISVNGCGLKTEENLAVSKAVPLDKLMLETDAPWCTLTATHASKKHLANLPSKLSSIYFPPSQRPERFISGQLVKGRNEPCAIGGVAWVIAQLRGVELEEVTSNVWRNTVEVFRIPEANEAGEVKESSRPKPAAEFNTSAVEWPSL